MWLLIYAVAQCGTILQGKENLIRSVQYNFNQDGGPCNFKVSKFLVHFIVPERLVLLVRWKRPLFARNTMEQQHAIAGLLAHR